MKTHFMAYPVHYSPDDQSFAQAVKVAETYGNGVDGKPREIGIYKLVAVVKVKCVASVEPLDGE
jgi:hypothetical protein